MEFYAIGIDGEIIVKHKDTGHIMHLSHADACKFFSGKDWEDLKDVISDLSYIARGASNFLVAISEGI